MTRLVHFTRRTIASALRLSGLAAGKGATVYDEMRRGAIMGCVALFSICLMGNVPLAGALSAALGGVCAGGVIGLVLWSGSSALPEDRVVPPAPGQERGPRPRHPHSARSR